MADSSIEKFIECIERSELIAKDELARALGAWKDADPAAFETSQRLADKFVEAKLLTPWQATNLLAGKSAGFFLGQYKLLGILGTGDSSSVYLAQHTRMPVRRAIKVLPVSRANSSSWLARFGRQASFLAAIVHPNIAPAFDINQHKKHHYLVLEYIEGHDLDATVKAEGPLEPGVAADIVRQAAEALAHVHDRGLVHRDIKPSHLMVGKEGTIRLLGWSMSRSIGEEQTPLSPVDEESLWSTFDYLAPEQVLDHDLVDPRSDIYSLGCTLYFALTGHALFADISYVQRILKHQSSARPNVTDDRPDVPPALAELCSQMMAKSPHDRPQTAKDVGKRLQNL
jgi:eukaryotic-like serine/threonine-protein kinase